MALPKRGPHRSSLTPTTPPSPRRLACPASAARTAHAAPAAPRAEARARWAEEGAEEGDPWQACAAELRALIAQLGVEPDDLDAMS